MKKNKSEEQETEEKKRMAKGGDENRAKEGEKVESHLFFKTPFGPGESPTLDPLHTRLRRNNCR
jgi:hypothetical protein